MSQYHAHAIIRDSLQLVADPEEQGTLILPEPLQQPLVKIPIPEMPYVEQYYKPVPTKYIKQVLNFEQTNGLQALRSGTRLIHNSNVISKLANKGFAEYNNYQWSITNKGLDYLNNAMPM
jgi:hypothetical protein